MLAIANLQYAWTFFTTDITRTLHARLDAVQWTLTFFIIAQTVLFPINAYLVDRFGPRLMVTLASFVRGGRLGGRRSRRIRSPLFMSSMRLAGLAPVPFTVPCVGVAMKWFPDRRGLCVGVVAGSYGFGTALTIRPVAYLIEHNGYRTAFVVFGILQGVFVLLSAQFLRMPPTGWVPAGWEAIKAKVQRKVQQSERDYTPAEMLRSGSFHLLYLMMTLVTASGLMLTAQLKPIGVTYGYDKYALFGGFTVLTLASSLNQVLNGSARPFLVGFPIASAVTTHGDCFRMEAITITLLTVVVAHPSGSSRFPV
jgi:OFA family oxalate/formate antiporter-like MFS transporter